MAKWTKTEVHNILSEALAPVVASAGFCFKKSSAAFVRKIDGGRQELGLPLYTYHPVYEFSFTLCVRIEAAQEIINRFSGSPPKYHSMALTSITQLEHLGVPAEPGRGVIYRVSSEAELRAILPAVLLNVRRKVLPFFDEYRNIEALNRGLNPVGVERQFKVVWPPDRHAFDATNQPYRSMTGVVAAYLARDPRLPELIAAYRAQIKEVREDDRQRFEDLVASLYV